MMMMRHHHHQQKLHSVLHRAVEGPVADDRMSSFPPACCCWRGTCRVWLLWWDWRRRVRGPGAARSRPCGEAQRSCVIDGPLPRAGVQLPVDCVLLLGGWLVLLRGCDACCAVGGGCNRGPPSSTSASTSGLSRPVLPRRLWRVVSWVGFLSDVIGGVEIALWEGCYPASALAHGVCVIVYV
jgi:hypothetical protein